MKHLTKPRPQLVFVIFVVLVSLCVALIVFFGLAQQARIDTAERLAAYRLSLIQDQQSAYDSLLAEYTQVTDDCTDAADCVTTATPPSLIPDSQEVVEGAPGLPGSPGLPGAAGARGEKGDQGDMGVPGQSGLPGPAGTNGADGTDGSAGTNGEPGPAGPAGPAGADGAPGAPGANGNDGRGLAAVECQPDGTWLITYTDGTTSTTSGPCRVPDPIISIPEVVP
ncbi:MAG: collagen-like protein [Herbiconiux sp.]|uniref:collagen-like triple helix repeat-containing protein n=1 Tax=Herbiconiux sp. TaxID=1871186 RepID=UPI00120FD31D|nr:collagen-like protein [Herbiconiux sp.]TAJ46370.1 MAG: collagen-like protein [Herbiconiux sp.]